ncbi:MAG: peptidase M19 [Spirochaetae bacterium HGW-Spirochaetae-3]|jgi:membrane dipeptidase|nr:MAG: peptidase M19 [Spirochaetae bacterium HGW-Spirochaetae-3]
MMKSKEEPMENPKSIYERSVVIDMTCPAAVKDRILRDYRDGGLTAIAVTAGYGMKVPRRTPLRHTEETMAMWTERIRTRDDLVLVTSVKDIYRAKSEGKLGIILHFQGTRPFEGEIKNIGMFYKTGLRVCQLCYNVKDLAGCGCTVEEDTGLTEFGGLVVAEANRLGVLVDCAHTGAKTTLDAIDASSSPVIISHGNARAVHDNDRNLNDDVVKAIAKNGGVIGINGFPSFVSKSFRPSLDEFIDHIDHIVRLAGVEHVGLGIDYFEYQAAYCNTLLAKFVYRYLLAGGAWNSSNYAPPPWHYPQEIETPLHLGTLSDGLSRRGFSPENIASILGGNILRVYGQVWK